MTYLEQHLTLHPKSNIKEIIEERCPFYNDDNYHCFDMIFKTFNEGKNITVDTVCGACWNQEVKP